MRGEYHRADGLVIPNNITQYGAGVLLLAALRDEAPTFHMALSNSQPNTILDAADLGEPTIGVNGYQRLAVGRSALGWPISGESLGESFLETDWLEWTAVGGAFSGPVTRVAFLTHPSATIGQIVVGLSAALPVELLIDPDTAPELRRFKYRIYA